MKALRIGTYIRNDFPSNWNEFSDNALLTIAENMVLGLSPAEMQFKALCAHFNWKVSKKKVQFDFLNSTVFLVLEKDQVPVKIKLSDIGYICSDLKFLFEITDSESDSEPSVRIDSALYRNPLPFFELNNTRFYGPSDCLTNITFEEYTAVQTNFARWIHKRNDEDLLKMISTIYRPSIPGLTKESKEYKGDLRETFNSNLIDSRAKLLSKLDRKYINLILLFYQGCLKFIEYKFPETFPGEDPNAIKIKKIWRDPFDQFQKMTTKIAGGDVTKKPFVRNSFLYDVLFDIEEATKDYRKWKSNLPKNHKS